MTPIVYKTGHINADTVADAFMCGTGQAKDRYPSHWRPHEESIPVFFGILRGTGDIARRCMEKGTPFVYIDHGYMNPGHFSGYYRCVWNDLHAWPDWEGKAYHYAPKLDAGVGYGHVAIAPPSHHVASFWGFDRSQWIVDTLQRLSQITSRRVIITDKNGTIPGLRALNGAHALITLQSNLSIAAAALGIPVIVVPPRGIERDRWHPVQQIQTLSLDDIESAGPPDGVGGLLSKLRACQFTLDDMRNGKAWAWMKERLPSLIPL